MNDDKARDAHGQEIRIGDYVRELLSGEKRGGEVIALEYKTGGAAAGGRWEASIIIPAYKRYADRLEIMARREDVQGCVLQ